MIAPDVFATKWDTPLVVLPLELSHVSAVNSESLKFLTHGGLPAALIYGDSAGPAHLSFARLGRGLIPMLQAVPSGLSSSPDWDEHFVLGAEWFEGGASPFWCVHGPSGRVEVIDLESDDERPRFVNTSIAHLAQTLLNFREWARQPRNSTRSLRQLRSDLEQADPGGWPKSRWAMLLEHLASVPIADVLCEADRELA